MNASPPRSRPRAPAATKDRDPERPLNVGYICGTQFDSDALTALEPVLQGHRRGAVRAFAMSRDAGTDTATERLIRAAYRWTDIAGVNDETAWQILRGDDIDVVVDLVGHGASGWPLMLARRPAPITLGWLGHPLGNSSASLDHVMCDERMSPAGNDDGVLKLSRPPIVFHPPAVVPEIEPAPALSVGHATFGAQLDLSLVDPRLARLYGRILRAAPGARLLLCNARGLDQACIDRTLDYFAHMGVRDRVDVINPEDNFRTRFEFYQHIDVALDTVPLNGTIETCRALWMGVPVLTLAGDGPGACMGASLLGALGRPEWITTTEKAYIRRLSHAVAPAVRIGRPCQCLSPSPSALSASAMAAASSSPRPASITTAMWRWRGA